MLDADNAAFIQSSVSISLATCGVDRLPNLMRAVGCKLLGGGRRVGIFLNATLAAALLADIRANRRVACVFCLPSTNRTLQLKGEDAAIQPFDAADLELIAQHVADFGREVAPLGVPEAVVQSLFAYQADDLVMVVFSPSAVFSQTPGPKAGQCISGAP